VGKGRKKGHDERTRNVEQATSGKGNLQFPPADRIPRAIRSKARGINEKQENLRPEEGDPVQKESRWHF